MLCYHSLSNSMRLVSLVLLLVLLLIIFLSTLVELSKSFDLVLLELELLVLESCFFQSSGAGPIDPRYFNLWQFQHR